MQLLVCNGTLWIPTSVIPNPTTVQHLDPGTFYTEYGLVVPASWNGAEVFREYLETGSYSTTLHIEAPMDLGVTYGHDQKLRVWQRIGKKIISRVLPVNERIPRAVFGFQDEIEPLDLATAIALQQFAVEGVDFDGGFLSRNPHWTCHVPMLIDTLSANILLVRPSREWTGVSLAGLGSDFKPIPVIVGKKTKKG